MKIELKRLTENELELMMNWRMREDITKQMLSSPKLTMDGQRKWFEKLGHKQSEIRWIVWADDKPVGSMYIVDIDYDNKRCETGWFIAERGGFTLREIIRLQQSLTQYAFDVLGMNRIYGDVIDTNYSTAMLLSRLIGYKEEGRLIQHVHKDDGFHDVILMAIVKDEWVAYNSFQMIPIE